MVDWLRFGADMEDLATQTLRTGKRVTKTLRPTVIQPYRGFVADGVANVRARVMEKPYFDGEVGGLRIDATLASNLLRWIVLDIAGLEVTVEVAGNSVTANSDEDGFVIAKVPVGDIEPGWHEVKFSAIERGEEITARGRVVLPDPESRIGVITDIDDTILATGMTEGIKAMQRTLLRDAYGRKPISGTPSLYRGLARGTDGRRPESTFFYVSSGPWNLYDMLVQFLGVRGFPRGPMFMTDWRPGFPRSDEEGKLESRHKKARIRRILDAYPELDFVLIGDNGEKDPVVYQEFLESDNDRLRVVLIRDVEGDSPDLKLDEVKTTGPAQMITVNTPVEMAEILHKLGLIDELSVEEVMTEIDARV